MSTAEWHGTLAEFSALSGAISRYCQCEFHENGMRTVRCAAHEALDHQDFLDHVLCYRRISARLVREEFTAELVATAIGGPL